LLVSAVVTKKSSPARVYILQWHQLDKKMYFAVLVFATSRLLSHDIWCLWNKPLIFVASIFYLQLEGPNDQGSLNG